MRWVGVLGISVPSVSAGAARTIVRGVSIRLLNAPNGPDSATTTHLLDGAV